MTFRKLIITAAMVGLVIAGSPAVAQAKGRANWCFTYALSPEELAANKPSDIKCYPTEKSMEQAAAGGMSTASFSNQRLARHHDTLNQSGASLSVYGTNCGGGGTSLTGGSWDNRIRSTVHGACRTINHYATGNYSDSPQVTTGFCGNPRGMDVYRDQDVSAILYFSPEQGGCSLP